MPIAHVIVFLQLEMCGSCVNIGHFNKDFVSIWTMGFNFAYT